jgi:hypothetical protein
MAHYYVNKRAQANGDHEVHRLGCSYMPVAENRKYLGDHSSCYTAVAAAKREYRQVNGCYYCSRECHTS